MARECTLNHLVVFFPVSTPSIFRIAILCLSTQAERFPRGNGWRPLSYQFMRSLATAHSAFRAIGANKLDSLVMCSGTRVYNNLSKHPIAVAAATAKSGVLGKLVKYPGNAYNTALEKSVLRRKAINE